MNIKKKYDPYTNTILDIDNDSRIMKSIFVSIVSYKDPNIIETLDSLFSNCKNSKNIFVSVAVTEMQHGSIPWVSDLISYVKNISNVRLNIVNLDKDTTFGKLKKLADSEYNKEDYYLSISSRTQFDPHWDDILIKQYETISASIDQDVVLTADPRRYLPHEDIVKGFVYYTNHKTKKSLQREEYDGARIPISGYNEFISESNLDADGSIVEIDLDGNDFLIQKNNIKVNEDFLKKYGVLEFNSRKFIKDEYIAIASGISSRFIFSDAKLYLKNNSCEISILDEIQFNFYSFINFIKGNVAVLSVRFTPIYYLYQDGSSVVLPEYSPANLYSDDEYKNSDGAYLIDRYVRKYVLENDTLKNLLSVDWNEKKFKIKDSTITHPVINAINIFISLYNFSTYENSLHWNKKC
jgi:hypothetical protein